MLDRLEDVSPMSTASTRAKIRFPSPEVMARQGLEDERSQLASAADVQYHGESDTISLRMQSGIRIAIPRKLVDELAGASGATLEKELAVGVGGDVVSVPSLDVDIAVPGLLRDLLGFNIQRRGGQARSEAKAAASRANGTKGGRPPKKHAAA
jgi:hypothetical protein